MAAAAVLLLTTPLAASAGGPDHTGDDAAPVTTVAVAYDDAAELAALRRHTQRVSRQRRQAEQAAVAAVAPAQIRTAPVPTAVRRPAARARKATRPPVPPRARRGGTPPVAAPADGSRASVVIAFALAQVGKPYIWASAGPRGYDCSGLLLAAFARVGVGLPHQSGSIAGRGRPVPRGQWAPGDVLVWRGHVALYLGGGRVVHAPGQGRSITVAPVWGSPSARRLL